jgi:hypothetical protein
VETYPYSRTSHRLWTRTSRRLGAVPWDFRGLSESKRGLVGDGSGTFVVKILLVMRLTLVACLYKSKAATLMIGVRKVCEG